MTHSTDSTRSADFVYRALRRDGVAERGSIRAESHEAAVAALSARGLFPLELAAEASAGERRASIPAGDLALGLRVLSTLLESGLPISRALAALEELVPASWRGAIPSLREAVREGKSLGAALGSCPIAVPPVVVGMVRAGEGGSGLALAVRRAAELMENTAAARASVRSALAYPILLAVAGVGSTALLVGVVLPRFATILSDLGQRLPPTTRLVLGAAELARVGALPALVALVMVSILWRAWVARDEGRRQWHELLLAVPVLGAYRRVAATARVASALSALLESGVPVATAIAHAARTADDAALEVRLRSARTAIVSGSSVASALSAHGAMTATAARLVKAGEESGRLAAMLAHAARLEGERATEMVKSAVRLLEPGLILVFGGLIALVAASLLQAVYAVRPAP
ncbi:MAG: type II secretion system F family protein [Gemmatimonadaceae bacterium]